jgi:glyceraldehyde-3-phosphate dehydrogenase (NADP+)
MSKEEVVCMSREFDLYINGKWVKTRPRAEVRNPYNQEVVGKVAQAGEKEMDQAIAAAGRAFEETRKIPAYRRAQILERIVSGLVSRREEIAKMIVREAGKPWQYAAGEVDRAISTFTIASEEAKRINGEVIPADRTPVGEGYTMLTRRFPIGPLAAISPFNFPLNLVAHKVAPALAVGNTIVLKPPHQAPLTSLLLAEIVEKAEAPPGMFNVVPCSVEVAEKLATDERIKMLSFTGSAKVGWYLKGRAGKKRVALELGGNAAAVVHEDADLDWTAKRLAIGAFAYAGQICISIQRIYIQETVYKRFTEGFLDAVQKVKVGNPMDHDTVVGPLIDTASADRVEQWIKEAKKGGARIVTGGGRKGNVIEPTVISDADPALKVSCQEVFGPVVTVAPYKSFDKALALVNDSSFGLQAGLFTYDMRRILQAFQELEVGGVMINEYPTFRVDHMPYGGIKDSGLGREGVKYAMEEMTEIKLLVIKA